MYASTTPDTTVPVNISEGGTVYAYTYVCSVSYALLVVDSHVDMLCLGAPIFNVKNFCLVEFFACSL